MALTYQAEIGLAGLEEYFDLPALPVDPDDLLWCGCFLTIQLYQRHRSYAFYIAYFIEFSWFFDNSGR